MIPRILLIYCLLGTQLYSQNAQLVIPKGHADAVTSLSITSDGKYLISGSRDRTARLWDLKGNEIIYYPTQEEVQSATVSSDGKWVSIGSTDGQVRLLNTTGEVLKTFSHHRNFVNAVAFSRQGNLIASASDDKTATVIDYVNNKTVKVSHSGAVRDVSFDAQGKQFLTASADKTTVLWSPTGARVKTYGGHSAGVNKARMSAHGEYIVTCGDDKLAILWGKNGNEIRRIKHSDKVTACAIAADNQTIVTGSFNGEVKVWNATQNNILTVNTKGPGLSSICIPPDGGSFITASADGIVQWNFEGKPIRKFEGHARAITAVQFTKTGNTIIQGDVSGSVKFWNAFTHSFSSISLHGSAVSSIAVSPDSQHMVSGSEYKSAVISTLNGKKKKEIKMDSKITSVEFSGDGKLILTGCYDGCTAIWDLEGNRKTMFKQAGDQISDAVFLGDGQSILTSSYGNKLTRFDLSGNPIKVIQAPSQINCISVLKDQKTVVAGYYNGMVQLWNVQSGENTMTLGRPTGDEVLSLDVHPDQTKIAAGRYSGTIDLYDIQSEKTLSLTGHKSKVQSLNFSPDQNILISGSADGTIKIWNCASGKELASLIALDSASWVVTTPEGLFDASPEAMLKLKYRVGLEMVDLDQLKERYYEPGLLPAILKVRKTSIRDVSTLDQVQLFPEIDAKITGDELKVKLTPRSGELGKLSLYINDKEVIEDANPERQTELKPIVLTNFRSYFAGDTNLIKLRSYNKDGWLKSAPYEIIYRPDKSRGNETSGNPGTGTPNFKGQRHLYALIVGTSDYAGEKMDLIYPDKDAKAFASAIKQVGSALFEDRVHTYVLTTSETDEKNIPSRKNIERVFKEISQKVTSEDVLIVYLSGHGTTYGDAEKSQFYYLTKDIQSENLEQKAIRDAYTISSDNLTEWLKNNYSRRQVVVIDACHSGDVVKSLEGIGARDLNPSQIKAFERMKDRTGIFILTGSAGDKVSYESSQFGQGLLTYSLLQGMKGEALTDDRRVDVATLFNFSRDRVPELAEYISKIQKPVFVAPHGASSFDLGISDKNVKIDLIDPKPIFIQNTFMNIAVGMDDLELTSTMKDHLLHLTLQGADSPIVYSDVDRYTHAYKMSGLYTLSPGKISITVHILRDKKKVQSITHEGNANNLKVFVEDLFEKVYEAVKDK